MSKKSKAPAVVTESAKKPAAPKSQTAATPAAGSTKIDAMLQLMRAKQGASLEQLSKATGWQHHSVRGAISGVIKKKLGLTVVSERVNDTRIYRIAK